VQNGIWQLQQVHERLLFASSGAGVSLRQVSLEKQVELFHSAPASPSQAPNVV